MVVGVQVAADLAALPAPADAEQLWRDWGPYMRGLVAKQPGIPPQAVDDVLANIVTRLLERDVLSMYDPAKTVTYKGRVIRVTFKAFLSSIVVRYVKGQRDKLGRQSRREALIMDRPQDQTGTTWAELFGGSWFDDYSHLDAQEFIDRMRAYLAMAPAPEGEQFDLVELFDELVLQVQAHGAVHMPELKEHLGVTQTVAKARLGVLREVLSGTVAEAPPPSWEVGGVTLGPVEVREAIAVLEGATGIMVRQPLAKAGHPLKDAAKGWYHAFSKEEVKLFPSIAIDPQTHRKPAGHVKVAVLHRLHRMLAEASRICALEPSVSVVRSAASASAQAPPPVLSAASPVRRSAAEPDSPRDLIEAELFMLGASPDKVDYILDLAGRLACS